MERQPPLMLEVLFSLILKVASFDCLNQEVCLSGGIIVYLEVYQGLFWLVKKRVPPADISVLVERVPV